MIDPIHILIAFVVSILTILLFIIGLEVYKILKELKITFKKINKILDDTGRITNSIATPIEQASEFIVGLKKGFSFINSISKFFKGRDHKKPTERREEEEEVEEAEEASSARSEDRKTSDNKRDSDNKEEEKEPEEEIQEKKKPEPKKKPTAKKRFFTKKGKSLGK